MRFTPRSLLTLLLVLVLVLAACQPATPVATVTPRPTEAEPEPTTVAAADEPTEEATDAGVEEATEESAETEVADSTETPVVEPTDEATEDSGVSPLGAEETREAMAELTEEARATEEAMATEAATEAATETEAATPTEEATITEEPTEAASPTAEASPEVTREAVAEATTEAAEARRSIADIAEQDGQFTILLSAVEAAGLTSVLTASEPLTVFAPTDEAFEALLETLGITADELLAREDLADILMYHLIGAEIPADTLQALLSRQTDDTLTLETLLEGQSIDITAGDDDGLMINGTATVVLADVHADNGVIHVIDQVLLPPSEE